MKLSPRQQEVSDLLKEGLPHREIAKKLGVNRGTISNHVAAIKMKAATDGVDPGYFITGKSELVGPDGETKLTWIKSAKDKENAEVLQEAYRAAIDDMPPLKPIKVPKGNIKDMITIYPMGDPHIGLYAYHKESGENFNCDIAEKDLLAATDYLVSVAPSTNEALIVNLGDYYHGDSSKNTTTAGTPIDLDTRWSRVLKIGISILIRVVERALEKHKKVTVINATGNHDTESSVFLCVAMWHHFKNNKRVDIREPNMFHFYEFGNNLFGVAHGHTIKKERLPGLMAMDMPEAWGRTKHRYWLTGHIHHKTTTEIDGCIVESFRTLAGKDAWHYGQGYRAGRDMNAIVYHKDYGESDRHRCDILRARS